MSTTKVVSDQERAEFRAFWAKQRSAVEGRFSEATMTWFCCYTAANNVGYEMGQLRPGKLGQWDLHDWLTDPEIGCDKNEAIIASGLSAAEVAEEDRREDLRRNFVDPDNAIEVAQHERLKKMTPMELDAKIVRLTKLLPADEQAKLAAL